MLKAISEGETRFTALAMASDTDQAFPSPDGPGRQFLAEFGEFPVYLVNRDMQARGGTVDMTRCLSIETSQTLHWFLPFSTSVKDNGRMVRPRCGPNCAACAEIKRGIDPSLYNT